MEARSLSILKCVLVFARNFLEMLGSAHICEICFSLFVMDRAVKFLKSGKFGHGLTTGMTVGSSQSHSSA